MHRLAAGDLAISGETSPAAIMGSMTGSELRRRRERAGLRQEDLAKLAGVSIRTIIRWEQGEELPVVISRGLQDILAERRRKS